MKLLPLLAFFPLINCCAPEAPTEDLVDSSVRTGKESNYSLPELSDPEKLRLGQQIWQNESGKSIKGLTHWNEGEEFPSFGIGHFIWYPSGFNGRWLETFPRFIRYAQQKQVNIPTWILKSDHCPWNSRREFYAQIEGTRLAEMRSFFQATVQLQTEFIIDSSRGALKRIVAVAPAREKQKIAQNYAKVASTPNGTYALIDYVNFKGDGTNPTEKYRDQGWGMMQVLSNMRPSSGGQDSAQAFAQSAKSMLLRRVQNSPEKRGEKRWTAGWNNRCDTYAKPF